MKATERFWRKVNTSGECWIWTAAKRSHGYGVFWTGSRYVPAHRFAFELEHGPIADGLELMHHCDTPACVRPRHLSAVPHEANVRDAVEKGRNAQGDSHGRRKVTSADVLAMMEMRGAGASLREIGSRFGLSDAAVSMNVRGKRWRALHGGDAA